MATQRLGIADYVVFVAMLVVSAVIGIYYACSGGKQKTAQEFLMANRQMGILPVSLSLLASFMSAITLLGTPAEMYQFGTQYMLIAFSYIIVMAVTAHVLLPVYYTLQITSAYEYLELRFSYAVRLLGTATYLIQTIIYQGIVLFAPALALSAVTGLTWWASVLILGIVCTFYTTIGGMKAVMWTDVFQILIMFAGMIAIIIRGSIIQGGFGNVVDAMSRGQRIEFFNLDPNPLVRHTLWSTVIGASFTWLVIYGTNQSQVQRYLTAPTMRKAQIALWLNLPGLMGLMTICSLCGFVAYAYYETCDPLLVKRIDAPDQVLPLFVMDTLSAYPGFAGLFISTIFSGALSTVSSGLNSLAAVTLEDLIKPCYSFIKRRTKQHENEGHTLSDETCAKLSKALALGFGLLSVALAFVASLMGDVLQAALGLFGILGGPLLGVVYLGMLCPCANWKGAFAGHIIGEILSLWVGLGSYVHKYVQPKAPVSSADCSKWFNGTSSVMTSLASSGAFQANQEYSALAIYRLSYLWQGAFSCGCTVLIGIVVSLITGPQKNVDLKLLSPVIRWIPCIARQRRTSDSHLSYNGHVTPNLVTTIHLDNNGAQLAHFDVLHSSPIHESAL